MSDSRTRAQGPPRPADDELVPPPPTDRWTLVLLLLALTGVVLVLWGSVELAGSLARV